MTETRAYKTIVKIAKATRSLPYYNKPEEKTIKCSLRNGYQFKVKANTDNATFVFTTQEIVLKAGCIKCADSDASFLCEDVIFIKGDTTESIFKKLLGSAKKRY